MNLTITQIARLCHETNRAYCQILGDHSQEPWDCSPTWQKNSARDGVRFQVSRFRADLPTSPAASHENWLRTKAAEGWTYGPVKDVAKKEHPCFVPHDQLPIEQQVKDVLFTQTVYALAPFLAPDPAPETAQTEESGQEKENEVANLRSEDLGKVELHVLVGANGD
jgi:hypothetical protein